AHPLRYAAGLRLTACASISRPAARAAGDLPGESRMSSAASPRVTPPAQGAKITISSGKLIVPQNPIVPFIEGDGTGPDIWRASVRVMDAAVAKAYDGTRRIHWMEVYAGEKSNKLFSTWLPDETVEACRTYLVSIKGPLTTPVGGGIRSLNVALRQMLDLYVCLRPVRWFKGVPSPVRHPEKVEMVIFRENTEDIYTGIEFEAGSPDNRKFLEMFRQAFPKAYARIRFPESSGIGIKPISKEGSERLIRAAIGYAVADITLQQVLTRPDEFDVIATPNLNGDYLSDALAAQVGGIGIAPGGNINYLSGHAVFEATHGTAPKYANLDKVNPGSVILSGVTLLEHLGWTGAAQRVVRGLERAITDKTVTYDFARQMDGAKEVSCSEFGNRIIAAL